MTESIPRKSSLSFLNPFRSKQTGSRSSSKANSISDLDVEDLKAVAQKAPPSNKLRKRSSPALPSKKSNIDPRKNPQKQSRQIRNASFPAISVADEWDRDAQTGERKDHTDRDQTPRHGVFHDRESAFIVNECLNHVFHVEILLRIC